MNTYWLLDSFEKERINPYYLPGQPDGAREMNSLGSVAEEPPVERLESLSSEIKYEPEASGSGQRTLPKRRLSYSAMHVSQSSC